MVQDEPASIPYATFPRRLLALCVDMALLFSVIMAFVMGVELVPSPDLWTILTGLLVLGVFLYEPLLVSITGGTIGHHALNLRVAKESREGNLNVLQAFIRMWLKGFLGVFSFFFMGLTQRHQALHDLLTKSSVQIKDPGKARASHYVFERAVSPGAVQVSKLRRVVAILAWGLASYIAVGLATVPLVSDECLLQDLCSEGEEVALGILTLAWFLGLGLILLLGWRGLLPGARARPMREEKSDG